MEAYKESPSQTWETSPKLKGILMPLKRNLEEYRYLNLVEQAKRDIEALEKRKADKPKVKKKSQKRKWQDKPIPTREEWSTLHTVFSKAAETGKKDDMEKAARKATSFDNRHGTDFIGEIGREIRKKPRFVKDGQFTKANGTKTNVQMMFELYASRINDLYLTSNKAYNTSSQQHATIMESIHIYE